MYEEMSNGELIGTLDDIVQKLAGKSIEEWAQDRSETRQAFNEIKKEISRRFREVGKNGN